MKMIYPNLENADPRHCIASKVMKCNRIMSQIFRKHLFEFGLTNSQMSIMFVIAKKKDVSQAEISKMLYLEKSTISRNMKRLFEKGYIFKNEKQLMNTTDSGKAFLEEIIPAWDKAMKEISEILDIEGIKALDLVLSKLTSEQQSK